MGKSVEKKENVGQTCKIRSCHTGEEEPTMPPLPEMLTDDVEIENEHCSHYIEELDSDT